MLSLSLFDEILYQIFSHVHIYINICYIKKYFVLEEKKCINNIYTSAHVYSCVLFMCKNRRGKKLTTGLYVLQSHACT